MSKKQKEATELEYLRYFHQECDFGPAHEDCVMIIQEAFEEETGKQVPKNWRYDCDDE